MFTTRASVEHSCSALCPDSRDGTQPLCFWGSESQVVLSVMLIRNLALQIKNPHEFYIL